MPRIADRRLAVVLAGLFAGTTATLAQLLLWLLFTDHFPALLFRDARLTAALLLGKTALPPPATFDFAVMQVATLIHFTLSVIYTALLAALTARLGTVAAVVAGSVCGCVLYYINLYGFTQLFPWFVEARGWIALVAHTAFGFSAIFAYRKLHG